MENLITAVLGVVFSVALEVIPGLTSRWDGLSNEWKKAVRAYAGAVIVVVLALLQYVGGVALGFPEPFSVNAVIGIAIAYAAFVLSAAGTYQASAPFLPRKQEK